MEINRYAEPVEILSKEEAERLGIESNNEPENLLEDFLSREIPDWIEI